MSRPWAVRLTRDKTPSLSGLRCLQGVQIGESLDTASSLADVWLRGGTIDDDLSLRLRSIPGARRFEILPDGQLVEQGCRVPGGRLPDLAWSPLAEWLQVALPETRWPGQVARPVPIRLVRTRVVGKIELLVTTVDAWLAWATSAPRVRLDPLRFAADDASQVAIHGLPVPPLPGERFTFASGLAVPAGWTWTPPVDAETLGHAFGLEEGDVVLLAPDGSCDLIESDQFVRASRSAARATAEASPDG